MKALYIDCSNGVSGDMLVGSLLDLSIDFDAFKSQLDMLELSSFTVEKSNIQRDGKCVCDYRVILSEDKNLPSMNIFDVLKIIDRSKLPNKVKYLSEKIFKIAASAGAEAHKTTIEKFFFHEKGAADSFADIVGFAICLYLLGVEELFFSDLYEGSGFIKIKDQELALPVPAVKSILKKYKLNFIKTEIQGELITPTGAAIVAATSSKKKIPENYKVLKRGLGNGKKTYNPRPILESRLLEI